jgi:hypothetical protein
MLRGGVVNKAALSISLTIELFDNPKLGLPEWLE